MLKPQVQLLNLNSIDLHELEEKVAGQPLTMLPFKGSMSYFSCSVEKKSCCFPVLYLFSK